MTCASHHDFARGCLSGMSTLDTDLELTTLTLQANRLDPSFPARLHAHPFPLISSPPQPPYFPLKPHACNPAAHSKQATSSPWFRPLPVLRGYYNMHEERRWRAVRLVLGSRGRGSSPPVFLLLRRLATRDVLARLACSCYCCCTMRQQWVFTGKLYRTMCH